VSGSDADGEEDASLGWTLFTYVAPLVGVLLVAVGIGAAVPGGYAIIQEDISNCGSPSISVDTPEETDRRFGDPAPDFEVLAFSELDEGEQAGFTEALSDPVGEAHVEGPFTHRPAFENGTMIRYEGERYYATIVAEHPCFVAAPLQFPLGTFAIALGIVGILTPPAYRKLVELEERANERDRR
jgi:hypothetical protein